MNVGFVVIYISVIEVIWFYMKYFMNVDEILMYLKCKLYLIRG